jgi:Ketopantoate reductase PanE/ApbA
MRITLVGAGALGRAYGARLAARGDEVAFVVRPERLADSAPFVVEQVNGSRRRDKIDRPRRVADIPAETQVVLITTRFDQLAHPPAADRPMRGGRSVADLLRAGPDAPVVLLTPAMPPQRAALEEAASRRLIPAMPNILGYIDEREVVRYWVTGAASTLIDEGSVAPSQRAALEELARRLTNADVPTRLERDVGAQNTATTTAFFPLIAAIDAGGGIDGVLSSKAVLSVALEAAKECEGFAHRLGKVAPWAHLLTKFVGPFTLKPGVALGRRLFPESVRFVEHHFGAKLHAQHLAMGATILAMAREQVVSLPALERLMAMIEERAAAR